MTVPTQINDHAELALDDVLSQFDDSEKLRKLVEIFADRVQEREDVEYDVLIGTLLDNAVGVQLDVYGRKVGGLALSRAGRTDDAYREIIRVAIQINQSDGNAEQAIQIVASLVGVTVVYQQIHLAHYSLHWELATPSVQQFIDDLNSQMPRITCLGSSWRLVEGNSNGDGMFRFDSGPGFDKGKLARRIDTL